jgi:hypothetical protein
VLFLHWAITLLILGEKENLRTLTDPTFTVAVDANKSFPSENGVVVLYMHMYIISQHLVTLVGVVFSFGFKSAIGVTMGFVRLQCLWLSAVRQPLTIQRMHSYWLWIYC